MLTGAQREFLRNEGETDNAAHDRALRSRIRKRIRAGLGDMALLAETLPGSDDWGKIFEDFEKWVGHERLAADREKGGRRMYGGKKADAIDEGRLMTRHLHGVAGFLYLAFQEGRGGLEAFENVIGTAIELAETTSTKRATVDVDITIEREPRPTELIEKFERGDSLTEEEYNMLVESGELEPLDLLKREGLLESNDEE